MRLRAHLRRLAVAAAVAVTPALAHAQLGVTFTAPGVQGPVPGFVATFGYAFTVLSPTTVIGLATYDAEKDGLIEPHTIGLWKSDGTLLVSATLAAGSSAPLIDFFRTTDTDPLALTVGQQYLVAGTSAAGDPFTHSTTGFSVNPKIRFDHDAFEYGSLVFPGVTDNISVSEGGGFFGGNVVLAETTTPEPATFVLMAGGLALVGVAARRRARRS